MTMRKKPIDGRAGSLVAERRKKLGMTQKKLADRLRIGEQQVRNYEKGRSDIPMRQLRRIAEALGCTMAELLLELDQPGAPQAIEKVTFRA